jgi:hypothetical protein
MQLLERIERGELEVVCRELTSPSPLAQEILGAKPYAFLDDAPAEERRTLAVQSRRFMTAEQAAELGSLDPEAIERVKNEAWPQVLNADELHDALVLLGFVTAEDAGMDARGRATQARAGMPEVEQRREQLPGAVAESSLALEQLLLVLDLFPIVGVGRCRLGLRDHGPTLGKLGVELQEFFLTRGDVVLRADRLDRALGLAERAVDALLGVDDQHVRTFVEAVDGAYLDAVRVLALDTGFGNDEGHAGSKTMAFDAPEFCNRTKRGR